MSNFRTAYRDADIPSQSGLRISVQPDGDVIIGVDSIDEASGRYFSVRAEFCRPDGLGGGRSRYTHAALLALAVAITKDNQERPI